MRKRYLLAGLAGVVGLVGVGAGVLSAAPPPPPPGDAVHGMMWGPEGMMSQARFDRRDGPRRQSMGPMFCGPDRNDRLNRMVEMIEGFANFSPEQEPAWQQLRDAVRDASAKLGPACDAMRDARDGAPTERLASIETMLSAGLDAVREVRPKFDAFYATLNDKQKRAIDRLVDGPGHPHRR
ncbi:MAG TPA: Spy/CpxP family protein refolding chaperone [Geminicoccaceae bacterium]|nr:Spy/CpxP family protein refolding chaperone [Geminicoccus sp.]HMU49787.1 Spy/CpxP family protein refolding chaperone [Geminicoccaceae bacterium]